MFSDVKRNYSISSEASFEFEGIGFSVTGGTRKTDEEDYTFKVEMYIDDKLVETSNLPTNYRKRKPTPFWKYQLPRGKHKVLLKILNPSDQAELFLGDLIIYDNKPRVPKY